jgi:hypothetical protein
LDFEPAKEDNFEPLSEPSMNPLSKPVPWSQELLKRIKLSGWWLRYQRGFTYEAILRDRILLLGMEVGFQDRWLKGILRHAISEFSKKGLGPDYYGYHNIDHELEAAYFTLLAASSRQPSRSSFTQDEMTYLFVAALFHDFDPQKQFDKPNEDAIEHIVRNDKRIVQFIKEVGLNIDIVIALIHRTAYPFRGDIAEHALARMKKLFDDAGIAKDDLSTRTRYTNLGWFLSVAERISGYSLGDFRHAMDLARKNAHALGWHPSVINERSVQYFSSLKEEGEMFDKVMAGVPEQYRRTFFNNSEAFRKAWIEELELRNLLSNKLKMIAVVEGKNEGVDAADRCIPAGVRNAVIGIYKEQALPIRVNDTEFERSLSGSEIILITLRAYLAGGDVHIVGYAKGHPLEISKLRRGTADENLGKNNTVYLEGIGVMSGFGGASGGHLLRLRFLAEASRRGYKFVTGYAHRDVVFQRIRKGERIDIVQRYDPDMLDYYRSDLADTLYQTILDDSESIYV